MYVHLAIPGSLLSSISNGTGWSKFNVIVHIHNVHVGGYGVLCFVVMSIISTSINSHLTHDMTCDMYMYM